MSVARERPAGRSSCRGATGSVRFRDPGSPPAERSGSVVAVLPLRALSRAARFQPSRGGPKGPPDARPPAAAPAGARLLVAQSGGGVEGEGAARGQPAGDQGHAQREEPDQPGVGRARGGTARRAGSRSTPSRGRRRSARSVFSTQEIVAASASPASVPAAPAPRRRAGRPSACAPARGPGRRGLPGPAGARAPAPPGSTRR